MFTGIVEELGRCDGVDAAEGHVRIACREVLRGARRGDSIAVNGCCLTVTDLISGGFAADVMPETLRRTTLGALHAGDLVNLEAAMRHDGRVGGHLVTGHIDGVGTVTSMRDEGNATWVAITPPPDLMPLLVEKGCIAIDGISLTVVDVAESTFTVALIPHTRDATTAGGWRPGQPVSLEGDLVAKYVQRGLAAHLRTARPVVLTAEA
jgi:riboflavin synthase